MIVEYVFYNGLVVIAIHFTGRHYPVPEVLQVDLHMHLTGTGYLLDLLVHVQ